MNNSVTTLNLDNPDLFALEITKTFLSNINLSFDNLDDYVKLFTGYYAMTVKHLEDIKNSNITVEQLVNELSKKYNIENE